MSRFGFDLIPTATDDESTRAAARESAGRLYGITDAAVAAENGYLPSQAFLAERKVEEPPTDAYTFVYAGYRPGKAELPTADAKSPGELDGVAIPPGGCLGEARVELWGSPAADIKDPVASSLRLEAYERAQSDPRVQGALGEWAACMKTEGLTYSNPLDIEFPRELDTKPTPREVTVAVADVGCKRDTRLIARWNAVDVEFQRNAIDENQLVLDEERSRIDAALTNAVEIAATD